MGSPGEARETELAELLREVRALRKVVDQLKEESLPARFPPDYAVAVRTPQPAFPPDYEVAVRTPRAFPPDYAVAVRMPPAFQPEYQVAVHQPVLPPTYEVLVKPVTPPRVDQPAADQ
jgi:hypothetical protein